MGGVCFGAMVGVALQQSWDVIKRVATLPRDFKRQYRRLEKELDKEGSKDLLQELDRELIRKCAQVRCWNLFKQSKYSRELEELEHTIERRRKEASRRRSEETLSLVKKIQSKLHEWPVLPTLPGVVLGIEKPLREVKGMLSKNRVVGVCGIAGCGKTTLVNKLCRETDITDSYELLFLPVSSSPDLEMIGQRLSKKLNENSGTSANEARVDGGTKKNLIVLDDVWSVDQEIMNLVDAMKKRDDFRLVITSRTELTICDSSYPITNFLGEDDARELFKHHALPTVETWTPDEQLIDKIVRGCKFHPLALTVTGRFLKKEGKRVWQHRADTLEQTGGIFKAVHEIFVCLSPILTSLEEKERECFLDLGSFPEGQTISATAIIDMWTETRDLNENDAYVILRDLERRSLVQLVDRMCGAAGDPDGSFSSLYVFQHDLLRELAIHEMQKEGEDQARRLIMEKRLGNIPDTWAREKGRTSQAKLVSINTGDMRSSDWRDVDLPVVEVLILNFSATSYCLPNFLQSMKNLKVLVVVNNGSNRAEISGLSPLSSLKKLKRVMFKKISFLRKPPQMVEGGLESESQKVVESGTSITAGASAEPPQGLDKLSLFLCDVQNILHIFSLFPVVKDLEIDCCIGLTELPDSICGISNIEKLGITNFPELERLPDGIGELRKLRFLRLHSCGTLKRLPTSLTQLTQLEYLDISYCSSLVVFPEGMENLRCLKKIDMRSCLSMNELPLPLVQMGCLKNVICDEDGKDLWIKSGFDGSKLVVRKEILSLAFLYG